MDIVSLYAQAGYALFPLNGKKPATAGVDWSLTTPDASLSCLDFAGNFGVVAGTRLIIDVDCKKGAPGKESFRALTADLKLGDGWETKTFVVKTGTGGAHVYLSMPVKMHIRKHYKQYPGIEFLHGPFYAVGAGSIHPDTGKPYEVLCGRPGELLEAPRALLEFLGQPEIEITGAKPEKGFIDDDPANIARFKEALGLMPEVPEGNRGDSLYIAACKGRDFGLSQDVNLATLLTDYNPIKLTPPLTEAEVESTVRSAYKHAKQDAGTLNVAAIFKTTDVGKPLDQEALGFDMSAKGVPQKTLNNAVNHLISIPRIADAFRLNVFSGLIEVSSTVPWAKERGAKNSNLCDEDLTLLKYFLAKVVKTEYSQQTIQDAVIVVSHKKHYHPVQNYLNSLVWDGVPRIDTWLSVYGHALDTPYTRAIGRKVLCAAVRRVFHPGCKWDHVLIIEGSQGIGKSTACRILGRNWAGDMMLDPHEKDSVAMMLGKWVIELSEMATLKWADSNALKSFITREKDTARLSYERHAKDYPRQSIFIGTVNPEHVGYLNDITGNRRYWIVRFDGPVNLVALENDCNQLWAEARAVYEKEQMYLTGEAERMQVLEAQARMPEDPMRANVIRWVKDNPDTNEITTEAILEYLGIPMKAINRADQSRVAQSLIELGWHKNLVREGGIFITRYTRPLTEQIAGVLE